MVVDERVVAVRDVEGLAGVAAGEDVLLDVWQEGAQVPVCGGLLQEGQDAQGAFAGTSVAQG